MIDATHRTGEDMKHRRETGFTKFITKREVLLLDEWFSKKGDNYQLVYNLMKLCGLRVSDAVKVREDELHDEQLVYRMRKTRKPHVVYLPSAFRDWLYDYYIPEYKDLFQDGYLAFANGKSSSSQNLHLQTGSIRASFCKFRQAYGLSDVYHIDHAGRKYHRISPHTLRHLFAEAAYRVTAHDARAVQDLLGHSKVETTFRFYLRGVRCAQHRASIGEAVIADMGGV